RNELFQLTLDQLRTFAVLYAKRSSRLAASSLKRQQTSILRQIRAINEHVRAVGGEDLIVPTTVTGGEILFSESGVRFAQFVTELVSQLSSLSHDLELQNQQAKEGRTIQIGTTAPVSEIAFAKTILEQLGGRATRNDLNTRITVRRVPPDQ